MALILSDNKYFYFFKDKNIQSSLGKKIFLYLEFLEENQKSSKNIIKDIILTGNLSKEEERNLIEISQLTLDDYSDKLKIEKGFETIFISWFILELKEELKKRSNFKKQINLKQMEGKLKETLNFNELQKIYEEFQQIKK